MTLDTPAPTTRQRRRFLRNATIAAGALAATHPLLRATAWAAGSDAPEKPEVNIGFIPLTDCAPVVMASVLGLDKKYGVTITPRKESSWAGVRDKLTSGELDFAHVLYGLAYGVQAGALGVQRDMAVLMGLNQNGQGITLSKKLADQGVVDGATLATHMARNPSGYTFAETFPTGTHAMWLYYWLAAHGINPRTDAKIITVPPPQMVANMRVGAMDGFCVGEPWNVRAIKMRIGFTAATTQDIWPNHPEKVLGATASFIQRHPNTARAVTAAILEACRWIDASPDNMRKTAETIAAKAYVNAPVDTITERMLGQYDNGLGKTWNDAHPMRFFGDGAVNFPYVSDGMWFMTQHKRWGLLDRHPDYLALAQKVNQTNIYRQAADAVGVSAPGSDMRTSTLLDGTVWDGSNPAAYADSFAIKA